MVGCGFRKTSTREGSSILNPVPILHHVPLTPASLGGDREGRTQRKHLAGWAACRKVGRSPASRLLHPCPKLLLGSGEADATASQANRGSRCASCGQLRPEVGGAEAGGGGWGEIGIRASCDGRRDPGPCPASARALPRPRGGIALLGSAQDPIFVRAPPEQTRRQGREAGSAALFPS